MTLSAKCLKRRSRLPLAAPWGVLATTAGATMSAETPTQVPTLAQAEPPGEQRIDASVQKALVVTTSGF
jgi:hypothetical protein